MSATLAQINNWRASFFNDEKFLERQREPDRRICSLPPA